MNIVMPIELTVCSGGVGLDVGHGDIAARDTGAGTHGKQPAEYQNFTNPRPCFDYQELPFF